MANSDKPFGHVARANLSIHTELIEQLRDIRDLGVSDDNLQLEAAIIIDDCQKPLLDIIVNLKRRLECVVKTQT